MDPRAIQSRALRDFVRWMGCASEGARVVELAGVTAAIVPATGERSIINSVVYSDGDALAAVYDEFAAAYRDAGIKAWTVWAPEDDKNALALIQDRGHVFDGQPLAMTMDLARGRPVEPGDLDWDAEGDLAAVGAVNDSAYGYAMGEGMAAALAVESPELPVRLYRARENGDVASVLATIDHEDDLGIYLVATREEHRGRNLASRLLSRALAEGAERGLKTSSLQSSAMGSPVYRKLGYEPHFAFHLYEHRDTSGGSGIS